MKIRMEKTCEYCKWECVKFDDEFNGSFYCGNENSGAYNDEVLHTDTCDFWKPYTEETEIDPDAYPDRNDDHFNKIGNEEVESY